MDVTTRLYHNVANCKSEQIIRGVLDDRARGVFQGKIRVAPNAQNTGQSNDPCSFIIT